MSLFDRILGRALASWETKKQELTVWTGVSALGLDALASTAYGPEAMLMILLPLGTIGLHYFSIFSIFVVATLFILYLSYQQTAAAYPNGGGAYIVASQNLGKRAGLWAAVALLIDYLLNVAVGISAGVGAIVSAFPILQPYTLTLCLVVLVTLTFFNLRGIRESGLIFAIPTLLFVLCLSISIIIGVIDTWQSGGHPTPVIQPPSFPPATTTVSLWLLLSAFANGLTAMTGVEAVSNAVPIFCKPSVTHARWTLSIIVGILALLLLAFGYLCPAYQIVAMDESQPGYQTMLSQLVGAVTGKGLFYYFSIISIFTVLTYSAQTSFTDFPRVCRQLAEDGFLPHFFAEKGRRLVYSYGISILAILSAVLLVAFGGITFRLIPLFAVGAFSAFLFSQTGMVVHWLRQGNALIKLFCNALGAVTTAIALSIIIAVKFVEGAWIVVILVPSFVLLLMQINRHYKKIALKVGRPLTLEASNLKPPVVIIPINGWDCIAEKAVHFGLLLSDDVTAIYISTEVQNDEPLKKLWTEKVEEPAERAHVPVPKLQIINSPYRRIYKPILDFVKKVRHDKPDRLIAVIIPELVEPHWYESLLHNLHAAGLRALLFMARDQRTIVISTPWYLRERARSKK